MNLSDVVSIDRKRDRKRRVGRGNGSGNGKTSGRGMRGSKSRAGWGGKIGYEGGQMQLFRALPRRGFNNKRFQVLTDHVNVKDLASFQGTEEITPEALKEAGLISRKAKMVKVLGDGTIDKSVTVHAHKFSKTAQEKIEAAGGTVKVIG